MDEQAVPGRLIEDEEDLAAIVRSAKAIAVVGMKDEAHQDAAAFAIPAMLQARGFRVIPVNPEVERALGETAYPDLASVPDPFDLVEIFRRSSNVPAHVDEILALPAERRPAVVWMQSGIRHDDAARRLTAAGIDVVQDRCLGVYASRYAGR